MDIKEYISSGIIESYVLGIATEEEVSILECVRNKHPEVEQAIREVEMLLEDTATIQAISPPASLKDSIWASVDAMNRDEERPAAKSTTDISVEPNSSPAVKSLPARQVTQLSPWAIAASALLIGSVGVNVYFYQQKQSATEMVAQLENKNQTNELLLGNAYRSLDMLQNPAFNMVALAGVESHPQLSAVVFWNKEKSEVYLMADRLPVAPSGKQYQLWALMDGQPIDAGMIPLAKDEMMHAMKPIADAQAFAITLEDAGGKPSPDLTQLQVLGEI